MIRRSPRRWWLYSWLISLPSWCSCFSFPLLHRAHLHEYAPLSAKAPQIIPAIQTVTRKAGVEIPPDRMDG